MKEKYNMGLVSVSFRNHSPKEILQAAKASGLCCIEWGSDVHAPCGDEAKLCEIAELQKQYGIICSSYGTYFRLGETPIGELPQYISAAKLLGTDILRLWCYNKSGEGMESAERQRLLSLCRQAADIAEKYAVTLCMECHRSTFTENPDDAVWLMKSVNSPNFRMYWQPFQWQDSEQNLRNAEKIAPYAEHIHVFNWTVDQRLPLMEAVEQWQGYLEKFHTPRTLLLEFMPNDAISQPAQEANALKIIAGGNI